MHKEESNQLGFWSIVLLGINGVIGSGIFLLPGKVMDASGNWSFAAYLFVAAIVLAIGWCFSQCAAQFNRNGGAYLYAKEAFGDFIGFEIGILRWMIGILAWATMVAGLATALNSIWNGIDEQPYRSLIIIGIVGSLSLLNLLGVRFFKYVNNLVTVAKIFPLIFFIGLGVFSLNSDYFTPLEWNEFDQTAFGASALLVFYAFGGFETVAIAAGEMKNPERNLPIAMMVIVGFCSTLYFIIHAIGVGILGPSLPQSATPLVDAAFILLGDYGKWFVTLAMLISIGGINISTSFITPRSGEALAQDGMIPQWIAHKNRYGTPYWSIILTMVLTAVIALFGTFTELVVTTVLSRFVQYISTSIAAYVLHRRSNKKRSSIVEILFILIPLFALTGITWLLMQARFSQILLGLSPLLIGIPLYWFQRANSKERKEILSD